jgi:hypothetical protein
MNALDLLLTSSEPPAGDACRHARASADGVYRARRAPAFQPLQSDSDKGADRCTPSF